MASLREEICCAGDVAQTLRVGIATAVVVPTLIIAAVAAVIGRNDAATVLRIPLVSWDLMTGAVVAAAVVALPTALAYRALMYRGLRRKVMRLPAARRAELLAPLTDIRHGDAREIVAPLIREFGLRAELAPANPPAARGSEATPAERPS